jgi:hypothetical protein
VLGPSSDVDSFFGDGSTKVCFTFCYGNAMWIKISKNTPNFTILLPANILRE